MGVGGDEVIEDRVEGDTERVDVVRPDRNELLVALVLGVDERNLLSEQALLLQSRDRIGEVSAYVSSTTVE